MSIQATEYNSLYFNQIRVLCTGSIHREICWANVSSDRPQQPRWLVVAQIIVLFVPFLIVDLLQMLWIQFDAWRRGIPLLPPLSVSPENIRKISGLQNLWPGKPSAAALEHAWREILRSKNIPLAPPLSVSSEDIQKISGLQHSRSCKLSAAALQEASMDIVEEERTKTLAQRVDAVAQWASREFVEAARTKTIVQCVRDRAGIVFSYLDSVEGFEISEHMDWDIEVARRETWSHNQTEKQIRREMQREENTNLLKERISSDAAAIALSYLEENEFGDSGSFRISARMRNHVQNAKDDTWLHNLGCGWGGYIHHADFCKIKKFAKRSDFADHVSKFSRKFSYLHVSGSRGLDHQTFIDSFSHLNQIYKLSLSFCYPRQDEILARAVQALNSQLVELEYTYSAELPNTLEALKNCCPNVKVFSIGKLPARSVAGLISHWKMLEDLKIESDNKPLSRKLLATLGDHLSSLKSLSVDMKIEHPISLLKEWEKLLVSNSSLQSISVVFSSFSSDILNATHTLRSNLKRLEITLNSEESNLQVLEYFREAPMSARLSHLKSLKIGFHEKRTALNFDRFQLLVSSCMQRYPKLSYLRLQIGLNEPDKIRNLLKPGLVVSCNDPNSKDWIQITSAGVTRI